MPYNPLVPVALNTTPPNSLDKSPPLPPKGYLPKDKDGKDVAMSGTRSGCSSDDAQLKRLSLAHGDPFAPWEFGRAAGGQFEGFLGGGAGGRGRGVTCRFWWDKSWA